MKNSKKQNNCMAEGVKAAEAGARQDTCPYLYDISSRSAWLVGWMNGGGNQQTGTVPEAEDVKSLRVQIKAAQLIYFDLQNKHKLLTGRTYGVL